MSLLRHILTLLVALAGCLYACPQPSQAPDSLRVSLLTCSPGAEIFELYGHEALRIKGNLAGKPVDEVYNYGVFDYAAPNFIYRFVKGETDYFVDVAPTDWFLNSYYVQGRRVDEQPLNLTQSQAAVLYERLQDDLLPENRSYRYRYFSNNCSTRILDHIDAVAPDALPSGTQTNLTYRRLIERYNEGYPWYQLGIDVALGSAIDHPISLRQTMFVPMELLRHYGSSQTLVEGCGDRRQPPTPWYLSPLFVCWTVAVAIAVCLFCGIRMTWLRSLWFLLLGLAGSLVFFLIFASDHEGTSPNLLGWWLNPLWLIAAATIWLGPNRFNRCLLTAGGAVTGVLLLAWPILPQSTNAALFPLMGATLLLCMPPQWFRRPFIRA